MYGSSLRTLTRRPLFLSNLPSEAAVMPFPNDETTPPVTKIYLTMTLLYLRTPYILFSGDSRRKCKQKTRPLQV